MGIQVVYKIIAIEWPFITTEKSDQTFWNLINDTHKIDMEW